MKRFLLSSILGTLLIATSMVGFACGIRGTAFETRSAEPVTQTAQFARTPSRTLRVATLNAAHGRQGAFHQVFLKRKRIQNHLDDISDLVKRERCDLVALQEIDRPSFWSGRFDQMSYLAEAAGVREFFHGAHVSGLGLQYGTGVLSLLPIESGKSATFRATPPTPPKGFVVSTVAWPETDDVYVDVVSVHLDFLTQKARRKQVGQMIERLRDSSNALIIMGDFNSEYDPGSAVRTLAEGLGLRPHAPEATDMPTYSDLRLDWILISDELKFVDYRTVDESLSDHRAIIADIELKL